MKFLIAVLSVLGCAGLIEALQSHLLLQSAWHTANIEMIRAALHILAAKAVLCT